MTKYEGVRLDFKLTNVGEGTVVTPLAMLEGLVERDCTSERMSCLKRTIHGRGLNRFADSRRYLAALDSISGRF